jgi:UDP-2,3-diacylglucosamine hydrolase
MQKYKVNTLIHGHTHRPNRHNVSYGERIVLGDWHDLGWVLCLDKEGYNLQKFAI